ncbi:MAG: formylglycine-generating enzyme family protein [Candidatus Margulisiibacteriota bacterium]
MVINGMRITGMGARHVLFRPVFGEIKLRIPEMINFTSGSFPMGSDYFSDTRPIRQVKLSEFAIGKYPVTNGEYLGYLHLMGFSIPNIVADPEYAMHPVGGISWYDAERYCDFLSGLEMPRIGGEGLRKFSLPTEAQWEYAARGNEGRRYPWGDEPYEGRVNTRNGETLPVDFLPLGATPSGVFDMASNITEWCKDWYGSYDPRDLIDPINSRPDPNNNDCRVVRGASFRVIEYPDHLLAFYRGRESYARQDLNFGFRIAEILKP